MVVLAVDDLRATFYRIYDHMMDGTCPKQIGPDVAIAAVMAYLDDEDLNTIWLKIIEEGDPEYRSILVERYEYTP